MELEKLITHSTFVPELSRALVLGDGFEGAVTAKAWEAALEGSPANGNALKRWFLRRALKLHLIPGCNGRSKGSWDEKTGGIDRAAREAEQTRLQLLHAVLALEDPFQEALLRHFYGNVPLDAVADFYAKPLSWAKFRLKKSLDRLRGRLDVMYNYNRRQWCAALRPLAGVEGRFSGCSN